MRFEIDLPDKQRILHSRVFFGSGQQEKVDCAARKHLNAPIRFKGTLKLRPRTEREAILSGAQDFRANFRAHSHVKNFAPRNSLNRRRHISPLVCPGSNPRTTVPHRKTQTSQAKSARGK
jgi:hypothetical protein